MYKSLICAALACLVAAVSSSVLAATPGQSVTITVPVTYAAGQLIDFEIHGPDGSRLPTPGCCQQQLPKVAGTSATLTYAVPASAVAGVYTIAVGVFSADWSHLYSWSNGATTFTVGPSSSGSSSGGTSSSSSTSSSSTTSSSAAGTTTATPGQSVTITVPVTYAAGQLIDFEIHGPDGSRLPTPGCCQQQLPKVAGTSATLTYAVPTSAVAGVYTIAVGVFSADWSHLYSWSNGATTFTVGPSLSGSSGGGSSSSSSSSGGSASSSSSSGSSSSGSSSSSSGSSSSGSKQIQSGQPSGPAATLAAKLHMPSHLLFGLGGQPSGDAVTLANAQGIRPDIIEAYLVGAGSGDWTTWNSPKGYFVRVVAQKAASVGAVPMYTLYGMAQNGGFNLSGLNSQSFMTTYWNNARLMYQQIAVSGSPALVNIEPDFWGVTEQQSNGNPSSLFAYVTSNPDCTDQPNTVPGIAGCLIEMARKYAPLAYVGFPPSDWGFGAAKVIAYMNAVGAQYADFIVAQTWDRDAGCYEMQAANCTGSSGSGKYWDETNTTHPNYQDHLTEMQAWHTGIGNLPIIWWQTPMGVPSSTPGGYAGHYRDNHVHYFLTHASQLTAVGGLGVVFGAGASAQTDIATDGGEYAQLDAQYLASPAPLP